MKSAVAIQHIAFEDLGAWGPLLPTLGFSLTTLQAGVDDLAAAARADLLIVLGGPIGIYETDDYPFLREEIALIRARLEARRPMIGVCLGAQAIAAAAGARVYGGPEKEIGFSPLTLTLEGAASCLAPFAQEPIAMHWHGDTFDLPAGAARLASTPLYENQAFSIGAHALGLQFHVEAPHLDFERWLIGHRAELGQAGASIRDLRADAALHQSRMARKAERVLTGFLDRAGL